MPDHPVVVDQLGELTMGLPPGVVLEEERARGELFLGEDANLDQTTKLSSPDRQ